MVRPTYTGKYLLVIMALLYGASITSQSGLLLLLVGIAGGCILINGVAARRGVAGVGLDVPAVAYLSEGQKMTQPWGILNRGKHFTGLLQVVSPAGVLLRLARLDAHEATRVIPDLVYRRRGVYKHETLQVTSGYPFGLVEYSQRLSLPGEVVVVPAVYPVDSPEASGFEVMFGGKHRGQQRTTSGTHFAGVRPFAPGDPLKQIHWKSSAKGLGLMVKTYEEELSGRVGLILDGGSSSSEEWFDDAVRAAGSLMFAALDEGHHVEWVDLGRLQPVLVPPFDDGQELLDMLARLARQPGCATVDRWQSAMRSLSTRCAVSVVVTQMDEGLRRCVGDWVAQGRRVTVYAPERVLQGMASLEMPARVCGFSHRHLYPVQSPDKELRHA